MFLTLGKPTISVCCGALLFCLLGTVCASKAAAQATFDAWTTDNGLPQNSIPDILQTRDGFLWLTTYDGLVRYDGVRFTVFNAGNTKGLRSSRLSTLCEDGDGALWIAVEGGNLTRYKDGAFVSYGKDEGVPDTFIRLTKDHAGNVVVESATAMSAWRDGRFVPVDSDNSRFTGSGFPVRSGRWYQDSERLYSVSNGSVTANVAIGLVAVSGVKTVYEKRDGELWVGGKGIILRVKSGKSTFYSARDGIPDTRVNNILEDSKGNVWFAMGGGGGLLRFKYEKFTRFTKADGLAGDDILSIFEDREGVLWVGTSTGLSRLRDQIITAYSSDHGLANNNTYPICIDREGAIWIGAWTGLTKYKDGVFTQFGKQYGVDAELVTSLLSDREGALWIGTFGGGVRWVKDGRVTRIDTRDGLPNNVVRAIFQSRNGEIWIGTTNGLARFKEGIIQTYSTDTGLPGNQVSVIYEDSRGSLLVGTHLGLARFADDRFSTVSPEVTSGVPVRAIYEDSSNTLWIGTYDRGLIRIRDGHLTRYTTREGLYNNGVFQILEDKRGDFWMSCNLGIYRVAKEELTDYAEGRVKSITCVPYGKRDGMLNSECNGGSQPAGIKAADGKLWFPTQGGIAVVDPDALPVSTHAPPVVVEEFLVDNEPVSFLERVEIGAGIENFEIHYTGLSFIMSDLIRFKYKLEGLDREWVEAGTRRVAYYSHVPPGSYTFRVIAANRDGVWNMEGTAVQVRIIPPFWRTSWFLASAVIVLAGVVLLSFKARINRVERLRKAQQIFSQQLINSQEGERKRIAAELHDSLGQQLLIIKNSALLGLGALGQQDRAREQLDDISETASQAIDEVREISYNLRPYQLDDLGVTRAIEAIIAKVAASSEIRFTTRLDRIDGLFLPEAEINIYRIVQECLNNVVKHSCASEANIVIERNSHTVAMTIQDNGRGFSSERSAGSTNNGGFGLKGIAERARMLGAEYVIHSAPGQGTIITLHIQAPNSDRG